MSGHEEKRSSCAMASSASAKVQASGLLRRRQHCFACSAGTTTSRARRTQKRPRGRPRTRPLEEDRKHRDLGSYNLFVMKAQNVAGSQVKNHRAFMSLIGNTWSNVRARCSPPRPHDVRDPAAM